MTILPPRLSTAFSTTSDRSLTDLQKPSMFKRLLGSAPLVACSHTGASIMEFRLVLGSSTDHLSVSSSSCQNGHQEYSLTWSSWTCLVHHGQMGLSLVLGLRDAQYAATASSGTESSQFACAAIPANSWVKQAAEAQVGAESACSQAAHRNGEAGAQAEPLLIYSRKGSRLPASSLWDLQMATGHGK